jgi:DNA-directed RNA polymerase sigma subunit (sigma70/sigma32)
MIETKDGARLLTSSEVAERLRVSSRRIRQISARDLPYVQLETRGRRAYAERDVLEYLERRTVRS